MARGLTDPIPESNEDNNPDGFLSPKEEREMFYEMQEVLQELIRKHNELYAKYDKLEDKLTDLRIQHEAAKLVWQKGI